MSSRFSRLRPLDPPSIQQLGRISIPTLVIVGERDVPDVRAIADILHQRLPYASKVVMAGVGHMSNMEDPELRGSVAEDAVQRAVTSEADEQSMSPQADDAVGDPRCET